MNDKMINACVEMIKIIADLKDDEQFKVCTYPGVKKDTYLISNYGKCFSICRNKLLTQLITDEVGKAYYNLSMERKPTEKYKRRSVFAHHLVAWEFCEKNEDPKKNRYVRFKDKDTTNIFSGNLEYVESYQKETKYPKQIKKRHRFKFNDYRDLIVQILQVNE